MTKWWNPRFIGFNELRDLTVNDDRFWNLKFKA